jgi:hypothetical protein
MIDKSEKYYLYADFNKLFSKLLSHEYQNRKIENFNQGTVIGSSVIVNF